MKLKLLIIQIWSIIQQQNLTVMQEVFSIQDYKSHMKERYNLIDFKKVRKKIKFYFKMKLLIKQINLNQKQKLNQINK